MRIAWLDRLCWGRRRRLFDADLIDAFGSTLQFDRGKWLNLDCRLYMDDCPTHGNNLSVDLPLLGPTDQNQTPMKTNLLRSFVAVAEARSFSNAAREIHLSQSAVSKHIARLETECGVRLVARRGRNVECTPAGSALLPRAREIVSLTAGLKDLIQGGTPGRDPDCISREPSAGSQMV